MDPQHDVSSEGKTSVSASKGLRTRHQTLASQSSATSSLRVTYGECHASGSRTPRTPGTIDEGAPLLADPHDDLERGAHYGVAPQRTEQGMSMPI